MRWFCSKVRSFTTDFGNELHLLEMPDVVSAVVMWVEGVPLEKCRHLVHGDRRLFQKAGGPNAGTAVRSRV